MKTVPKRDLAVDVLPGGVEEVREEAIDALVVDEAADDDKLSLAGHLVPGVSAALKLKGGVMTLTL